ncbi:MAG: hypothetical protein NC112_07150 [Oxalobacter formigenes]|nr:hypothetical protein [Oxalobacter formigenes]
MKEKHSQGKSKWDQLRCPGCGKRKLDAIKPYTVEIWCRDCKKYVVFSAELDKPEEEPLALKEYGL